MAILNLDKLRPEDNEISINGKTYLIPGDVPVSVMLDNLKTEQRLQGDATKVQPEDLEKLVENTWRIFKMKNDITLEDFRDLFTMDQIVAINNFIISEISAEETKEILDKAKLNREEGIENPQEGDSQTGTS